MESEWLEMLLFELKQKINEENLKKNLLLIHDSRTKKLIEETRPPYSIILNIVEDNDFQVFVYDERGYKNIAKYNLTEKEACEYTLTALRYNTKQLEDYEMRIQSNYGIRDSVSCFVEPSQTDEKNIG